MNTSAGIGRLQLFMATWFTHTRSQLGTPPRSQHLSISPSNEETREHASSRPTRDGAPWPRPNPDTYATKWPIHTESMFDALGAAPHQAVHLGRDPGTVIAVLCTRNFRRSPPRCKTTSTADTPLLPEPGGIKTTVPWYRTPACRTYTQSPTATW